MTSLKTVTRLIIMLITLALSNVLFAEESVKNAHKNIGAGNTISHADTTGHVNGGFSPAVEAKTNIGSQQEMHNDIPVMQQMQERQREMQKAQSKAFRRYVQERRRLSAAYNQTQRKAFIELMEERRALMKKMMDEHRQAAEERRRAMLLKMHQTSTTPARYYS